MDKALLLPCLFCGESASIEAVGRDWWRLTVDHTDDCFFGDGHDRDVPQTDESYAWLVENWNRRAPQPPSASGSEVADVAAALEQQRALAIVAAVRQQGFAKSGTPIPTAAESAFDLACEEIEHRLRTEKWELGGVPTPSASGEREALQQIIDIVDDCEDRGHALNKAANIRDIARAALAPSPGIDAAGQKQESALERFTACDGMDEQNPIERLRFFCSLAMQNGQDWLDVEPFFDALAAPPAAQPSAEWEAEAEKLVDDHVFACVRYAKDKGSMKTVAAARAALLAHLKERP